MSRRGRRYESTGPKLNYKKVFAVVIVLVVIIAGIFMLKNVLSQGKEAGKITSLSYYALYADNKWGIIDSSGKEVIAPSYKEMIKVPNSKKDVFLCTYDVNTETGEYKTKALNSKNEEIHTEYAQIEALENIDKNNNLWYEDDILKVEKDKKYGLIDLSGKEILPCEYSNITVVTGVKNSIKTEKDGKYGLVTPEGKVVLEPTCSDIQSLGETYKEGYIIANAENKYGVIDYLGKSLLANNYEKIEQIYGKDTFVVTEETKQKLVNTEGEVLLSSGYDTIKQILSGTTQGVVFVKDGKCGVMNLQGEAIIANEYDNLKEAADGTFIAKKDDKYGIIDEKGETKVDFTYTSMSYNKTANIFVAEDEQHNNSILDGTCVVKLQGLLSELDDEKGYLKIKINGEYKYYNFKFEEKDVKDVLVGNSLYLDKKDGKYGYVNSKGDVVVDYEYDDGTEQNEAGYVSVKKDGKWGSIDTNGKVVTEPTYNLDNNYLIDFVGKWHLGQDINMNYYCDK